VISSAPALGNELHVSAINTQLTALILGFRYTWKFKRRINIIAMQIVTQIVSIFDDKQ